jgi:hypothetical protein
LAKEQSNRSTDENTEPTKCSQLTFDKGARNNSMNKIVFSTNGTGIARHTKAKPTTTRIQLAVVAHACVSI